MALARGVAWLRTGALRGAPKSPSQASGAQPPAAPRGGIAQAMGRAGER
jgi:hypothetical protein